jgi:3-oxoacyl-[acyl-carrier protein] reductase
MTEDGRLGGRVVALTGASGGLGLLTTRILLQQGAQVLAACRSDTADLLALKDEQPAALHIVKGDIGEESTAEAIAVVARELGRLDVLIHNAATARDRSLVRMPIADWDEVIRVNLRGAFLTTKYALPLMMRRRYGRVIYVSSLSAVIGNAGQANYAASKAGLHGLCNAVAQEYSRYNVRSVVVAPGLLDVGLGSKVAEPIRRRKLAHSLLGVGEGRSVAATIAFLAGSEADFINGTIVRCDGGVAY